MLSNKSTRLDSFIVRDRSCFPIYLIAGDIKPENIFLGPTGYSLTGVARAKRIWMFHLSDIVILSTDVTSCSDACLTKLVKDVEFRPTKGNNHNFSHSQSCQSLRQFLALTQSRNVCSKNIHKSPKSHDQLTVTYILCTLQALTQSISQMGGIKKKIKTYMYRKFS